MNKLKYFLAGIAAVLVVGFASTTIYEGSFTGVFAPPVLTNNFPTSAHFNGKVYTQSNSFPFRLQTDTDAEYYRFDYGVSYGDWNFGGSLGNGLMLSIAADGSQGTNVEIAISDRGPVYFPWGMIAQTNANSSDAYGNTMTNALETVGSVVVGGQLSVFGNQTNSGTVAAAAFAGSAAGLTNFAGLALTNSAGGWLAPGTFRAAPGVGFVNVCVLVTNTQVVWLTNATTHAVVLMGNTVGTWTNYDNAVLFVNGGDSVAVTNASGSGGAAVASSGFQALH